MKTFIQFITEARLRMITVGPSRSPVGRQRQQQYNSERAAFRRAGMRRSRIGPNRAHFNAIQSPSGYTSTAITSFPNQSSYAKDALVLKVQGSNRVIPTSQRARFLKRLKKQIGNRTDRAVHNVDILPRKDFKKNEPRELITRGKSYHHEVRTVPEKIKSVGGKPGDKFVGKAMEVLAGSTNVEKGRRNRENLYSRVLKASRRDPVTKLQSGNVK